MSFSNILWVVLRLQNKFKKWIFLIILNFFICLQVTLDLINLKTAEIYFN